MDQGRPGEGVLNGRESSLTPSLSVPRGGLVNTQRTPGRRQPLVTAAATGEGDTQASIFQNPEQDSQPQPSLNAWASVSPVAKASGSRKRGTVVKSLRLEG